MRVLRQFLDLALSALHVLAAAASAAFKSRATLQLENLALRHQFGVLRRSVKRPKLTSADRFLWARPCDAWSDWRCALVIVKSETVIGWHRKGWAGAIGVDEHKPFLRKRGNDRTQQRNDAQNGSRLSHWYSITSVCLRRRLWNPMFRPWRRHCRPPL